MCHWHLVVSGRWSGTEGMVKSADDRVRYLDILDRENIYACWKLYPICHSIVAPRRCFLGPRRWIQLSPTQMLSVKSPPTMAVHISHIPVNGIMSQRTKGIRPIIGWRYLVVCFPRTSGEHRAFFLALNTWSRRSTPAQELSPPWWWSVVKRFKRCGHALMAYSLLPIDMCVPLAVRPLSTVDKCRAVLRTPTWVSKVN